MLDDAGAEVFAQPVIYGLYLCSSTHTPFIGRLAPIRAITLLNGVLACAVEHPAAPEFPADGAF